MGSKAMSATHISTAADQKRALGLSTFAFTVCFAVWTIFAIIGIEIKAELGLNETQFGLLVGTPILTGSLTRLILGIWSDQYGGRRIFLLTMLASAGSTFLLSYADSYGLMLVAALGLGLAGGCFAAGVAYVSKWYPQEKQGAALGIFGMGNAGAAVTKFAAPFVMVSLGWTAVAQIWGAVLGVTAIAYFLLSKDDPDLAARKISGEKPLSIRKQLEPLKNQQVWRFSLYYFVVFGAFVALALWLPQYLMGVYGLDIKAAGIIAAFFSLSASLFRAYGGMLSDKYGARKIMYATFGVSLICLFMLSYPATDYVVHGIKGDIRFSTSMSLVPFIFTILVLGFFMSLGKAAVYRHIPVYYPDHVGSVGGLVGMIGGLGGFILPIIFGAVSDLTGIGPAVSWCCSFWSGLPWPGCIWPSARWSRRRWALPPKRSRNFLNLPMSMMPKSTSKVPPKSSQTGVRKTRISGNMSASRSHAKISIFRYLPCCWPLRSGWSGRWLSPSCRSSGSTIQPISSSGSPPCPACRVQRCAYCTASWARFSAVVCGRPCRPSRFFCLPSALAMRSRIPTRLM